LNCILPIFIFLGILTAVIEFTDIDAEAAISPPGIQWQISLGGTYDEGHDESIACIQQTSDGGYIIAGSSCSNDGDVQSVHHGTVATHDFWVVKLDSDGDIEWERSLGGTHDDQAHFVQQTSDGGYIVVGSSYSDDGDVQSVHHGTVATSDLWVVKLDSDGDIEWERSLGGTYEENGLSIQQTGDGGYIVAGTSYSNDGDVQSVHHGAVATSRDAWIVKLDLEGDIEWERSIGGAYDDGVTSIRQTSDGGYIFVGLSYSNDGDVSGHHGTAATRDYWVVRLYSNGDIDWQKSLGGSDNDAGRAIEQTSDGGYIVSGYADSTDGDVSGNHGALDYWVVKLSPDGNTLWKKCLGGSYHEDAFDIKQTRDGGYIVVGVSSSNNDDVTGHHGSTATPDYWLVKLDSDGNLKWQRSLGGSGPENGGRSLCHTNDGGYAIIGYSRSDDGDVSGHHGSLATYDLWAVKLYSDTYSVAFDSQGGSAVQPVYPLHNTIITAPVVPARAGYSFAGWYKEATCVNAWNFATDTVTADITLYAKWTADAAVSPDVPAIPGAVASIEISGFPLTLVPGKSFDVTLAYAASGGGAPDPAPVLSVSLEGGSASLVAVEILSPNSARVTALPQDTSIARSASGNSAVYGEAVINFTATQTAGGTVHQKTAAVPLMIADELATPVELVTPVIDEFKSANMELASSDEYIMPGSVQPPITSLSSLDPDWVLLDRLDEAFVVIEHPVDDVLPVCFSSTGRDAANIGIDVMDLHRAGKKGLLPLTFRVTVSGESLGKIFYYDESLTGRILASPGDCLDEIFSKILFQKEILEGERAGWYTRLVDGVLKPREALDKGILDVTTSGQAITLSLSFYLLDDELPEAFEQDGYLIVPDGLHNGWIRDPVWLNAWKPGYAPGDNSMQGQGDSGAGGDGGCATTSGAAFLALALFAAMALARRRRAMRAPAKSFVVR
jgi:uncharacterized repeat protein (TIGR02543 family)